MKYPKQYVSAALHIYSGTLLGWFLLLGDSAVIGSHGANATKEIMLTYALILFFSATLGGIATLISARLKPLLKNKVLIWISGTLVSISTLIQLLHVTHDSSYFLIYLVAFVSAWGLLGLVSFFIEDMKGRSFNSLLSLTSLSIAVAVFIYFAAKSCSILTARIIVVTLPLLASLCLHITHTQQPIKPHVLNKTILKRPPIVASVEILFCMTAISFHRTNSSLIFGQERADSEITQSIFIVFLTLMLFVSYIQLHPQKPVRINKIKNFLLTLMAILIVYLYLEGIKSDEFSYYRNILIYWIIANFLIISTSIFIYQTLQLEINDRKRALLIAFFALGLAGIISTPWFNLAFKTSVESSGLNGVYVFPTLLTIFLLSDLIVRVFGPSEKLEIIHNGESTLSTHGSLWNSATLRIKNDNKLTNREGQVMQLLSQGYTAHIISERLDISVYTVRTYITRCYKKINVSSREELMQLVEDYCDNSYKTSE